MGNGKWEMEIGKCEKEKGEMKNIYYLLLTKEYLPNSTFGYRAQRFPLREDNKLNYI